MCYLQRHEINVFRVALSSDNYDFAKTVVAVGRRNSTGSTPSAEYNLCFSGGGVISYSGMRNWVKRNVISLLLTTDADRHKLC